MSEGRHGYNESEIEKNVRWKPAAIGTLTRKEAVGTLIRKEEQLGAKL